MTSASEQPMPARSLPIWFAPLEGVPLAHVLLRISVPVIVLIGLIVLWQIYATSALVNPLILPAPLHVWQVTVADWPQLAPAVQTTLTETAIGFFWALITGFIAGLLLDASAGLRTAFYPLLVASQSIPIIALAPLLQLWLGIGLASKTAVIILICFFPITVATLDGLRAADPEHIRLFRSFGASFWQILWTVRLPQALPSIFSGVRIAITYSVVGAIFSEYIGAVQGIGVYMQAKQRGFRIDLVIGAIGITALISVALFLGVVLLERLVIPWYFAERQRTRSS